MRGADTVSQILPFVIEFTFFNVYLYDDHISVAYGATTLSFGYRTWCLHILPTFSDFLHMNNLTLKQNNNASQSLHCNLVYVRTLPLTYFFPSSSSCFPPP